MGSHVLYLRAMSQVMVDIKEEQRRGMLKTLRAFNISQLAVKKIPFLMALLQETTFPVT